MKCKNLIGVTRHKNLQSLALSVLLANTCIYLLPKPVCSDNTKQLLDRHTHCYILLLDSHCPSCLKCSFLFYFFWITCTCLFRFRRSLPTLGNTCFITHQLSHTTITPAISRAFISSLQIPWFDLNHSTNYQKYLMSFSSEYTICLR